MTPLTLNNIYYVLHKYQYCKYLIQFVSRLIDILVFEINETIKQNWALRDTPQTHGGKFFSLLSIIITLYYSYMQWFIYIRKISYPLLLLYS